MPSLTDQIFVDLTHDLVANKANKKLLARASALMAEGHAAPLAWSRAKSEAGIPTGTAEYLRLKEFVMHDLAGGPAADGPTLPRTPVAQSARTAAVVRGDRDRGGSGHLANNDALAQAAAAWQAREQKRTGVKPSWKAALLAASKQASQVAAAEPPVSSLPQPKPIPAAPPPVTRGFDWIGGAWDPQPNPQTAAREAALLASRNAPVLKLSADGGDEDDTDTTSLAKKAHARMSERGQSVDPKSKDYLKNLKSALLEVSK